MEAKDIKAFCKKNNISYKDLSTFIGFTEPSLRTILSSGKISPQVEASINLLKENYRLKEELKDWQTFKEMIKKIS
ncbi:transcriptional regulator [Helicobacter sp. 13S00401-1]|uniref:transcriptional regulator n=1 Tax=Helicobacter sp. 13S00401-1 TaxID=1905758 RepID=UPI000BA7AF29|nr:transcriptional regulator [Helicobacter sp. 13S00401-1]PAF50382.1 transcriptional regulator [Helicobacter sp. 13S00401-1]